MPAKVARRLVPLVAVLITLTGCAGLSTAAVFTDSRSPLCEHGGEPGTPVVILEAQAVPSATLLPCIGLLPPGWNVSTVDIHNGRASFSMSSDRAGPNAVTVVLQRFCNLPAVTRVPTDEPGTRRFEQVGPVAPNLGYSGTRFYVFEGGCVNYRFDFKNAQRAAPLGQVDSAVTFITRDEIRRRVQLDTDGHAKLDP